jgi:hypothetical protein
MAESCSEGPKSGILKVLPISPRKPRPRFGATANFVG